MGEFIFSIRFSLLRGVRELRASRSLWLGPVNGLWIPALLAAAAVLLPVGYLVLRVIQADRSTWELILSIRTLETLARTVALAGLVTLASALMATPIAWLTVRTDLPFRRLWSVLSVLPLVIPSYVGAYLLVASLGPRGMLAHWLDALFGLQRLPSIYGLVGAVYVLTMLSYPYTLLSVRAGLHRLDPAMEEAARSLGHGPWQTFWRVILPQLRPALAAGSLLVALYVLRDFGAVSIMRYNTFTRVIYIQYSSSFDRTAAAALSLLLVLVTMFLVGLEVWTRTRARYYTVSSSSDRPAEVVRLGKWRWLALGFVGGIVVLALVMPASVLLFWLVRGLQAGERIGTFWQAASNSISVSAFAAVVTLLAAFPLTLLNVRFPSRLSSVLERLVYAAYAQPGIVVALALVFFGANYVLGLYQSLPMLVLAYLILFLSQAVGALRASLLQVNPSYEEAARSLGRRPWQAFRLVTLPLIRPGILTGLGLVFLTAMKELPATLILSPFGFKTLATSVWSAVSEAFFAQAAAPALLLILGSSVPMAFLILREHK